jgi:hypothetical protein
VALSLFGQGLTVKTLLAKLGLLRRKSEARGYEEARAQVLIASRALAAAEKLYADGLVSRRPSEQLRAYYAARLEGAEAQAREYAGASQLDEQLAEGLHRLGEIERLALRRAASGGLISEETAAELDAEIVRRINGVEEAAEVGEVELTAFLERFLSSKSEEE